MHEGLQTTLFMHKSVLIMRAAQGGGVEVDMGITLSEGCETGDTEVKREAGGRGGGELEGNTFVG